MADPDLVTKSRLTISSAAGQTAGGPIRVVVAVSLETLRRRDPPLARIARRGLEDRSTLDHLMVLGGRRIAGMDVVEREDDLVAVGAISPVAPVRIDLG
jgi:hypothetical protein